MDIMGGMPFFTERNRVLKLKQDIQADGELWSSTVPPAARNKLLYQARAINKTVNERSHYAVRDNLFSVAQQLLTHDIGLDYLRSARMQPSEDFISYLMSCSNEEFPDVLEALYEAINRLDKIARQIALAQAFERVVNEILDSYAINYSLEQGQVIPFSSRTMHTKLLQPTLTLLNNSKWLNAERPYKEAINEIIAGKYENAITDATTSLQEGLRIVGCKGKDFNQLVNSAKGTIMAGYDSKLLDGLIKLIDWTSAVRVNRGDSHQSVRTSSEDAWLVVHVVGALLMRLSKI